MNMPASGRLYSPILLGLATELARFPLKDEYRLIGEARSRTCGSTVRVGLELRGQKVEQVGLQISACAVGQASAAIMAKHLFGRTESSIAENRDELAAWLKDDGERPDWPELEVLEPAREFLGRHGAILLPWNGALDALSKASAKR